MSVKYLLVSIIVLLSACNSAWKPAPNNTHKATVYIFIDPECPISQDMVKYINNIDSTFATDSIFLQGVIAGKHDAAVTDSFAKAYHINFPLACDEDYRLADELKAIVTPEAFVLDRNGQLQYSGAINDRYESVGVKRAVIKESYLEDAIRAVLNNQVPTVKRTEPVGCIIGKYRQ